MAEDNERITAWQIPAGVPTTATAKPEDKYHYRKLFKLIGK